MIRDKLSIKFSHGQLQSSVSNGNFTPRGVPIPMKVFAVTQHLEDTGLQGKPGRGKHGGSKMLLEQQIPHF